MSESASHKGWQGCSAEEAARVSSYLSFSVSLTSRACYFETRLCCDFKIKHCNSPCRIPHFFWCVCEKGKEEREGGGAFDHLPGGGAARELITFGFTLFSFAQLPSCSQSLCCARYARFAQVPPLPLFCLFTFKRGKLRGSASTTVLLLSLFRLGRAERKRRHFSVR
jgi:hypothetical protein